MTRSQNLTNLKSDVVSFWDNIYLDPSSAHEDIVQVWTNNDPLHVKLMECLGNVEGKTILEIGAGNNGLGVFLALKGATVTSIDISQEAVNRALSLATKYKVGSSFNAVCIDALKISELSKSFDLIVGKFILHHIEPFEEFSKIMVKVLNEKGRGIFIENSASNSLLIFMRRYFVGRFGIPRYGDGVEFPFENKEMEILRQDFQRLIAHYPQFIFFRKLNTYIFRNNQKFQFFLKLNFWLDRFVFNYFPRLRKYSYNQVLEFEK